MDYRSLFEKYTEKSISGRYLSPLMIMPLLNKMRFETIGQSVDGRKIFGRKFGDGPIRILMWSQMHGNESTTTKALFDLMNFLESEESPAKSFCTKFSLFMVPMLNPDGSHAYTRENASGKDLNRDFCDVSQPETKALLTVFDNFQPDYCFNLHDQRTIFGAGDSGRPATVSFLSPSFNEARDTNLVREKAMSVIMAMNDALQKEIPGQVARFDDGFNPNCAGDSFQLKGIPTILFEAGHFPGDYNREVTRRLIFTSYLVALQNISENVIVTNVIEEYLKIPQNKINFNDFIYKNVKINYDGNEIITNFAAQYIEKRIGDEIKFVASIAQIGSDSFGHFEYDAKGEAFLTGSPTIGQRADFTIGSQSFNNGMPV